MRSGSCLSLDATSDPRFPETFPSAWSSLQQPIARHLQKQLATRRRGWRSCQVAQEDHLLMSSVALIRTMALFVLRQQAVEELFCRTQHTRQLLTLVVAEGKSRSAW
eukprot:g21093.t1